MKEVNLGMELIREGKTAPPFPWMAVLRSHCVALAEIDPTMMTAISVSTRLASDSADEVDAVRRLSRLLADEFGFAAYVRVSGRQVSVRFARATADSAAMQPVPAGKERCA
jgi:hypothetical protein